MWLTGHEIRKQVGLGRITIDPYNEDQLNSNSYNYTLGPVIKRLTDEVLDLKIPENFEEIEITEDGYVLMPGECYLGHTNEVFGSDYYASLVTGRSSVGRKFVTNHITAGLIDQGFFGTITLEITVQRPTRVYKNIKFGQIFWYATDGEPLLYRGKYQGQRMPGQSKLH